MNEDRRKTKSAAETRALGAALAKGVSAGAVFAFNGDLGAGKTVLAKGFAEGLGIDAHVTSPTFTILQVYEGGRLPLYHLDVYRLEEEEELEEIGIDDCFYGAGVCLVEWAEKVAGLLPPQTVYVDIHKLPAEGEDVREIIVRTPKEEAS